MLGSHRGEGSDGGRKIGCRNGPGRVAIGLDHRNGKVAVRGWLEESDLSVEDLIRRFTDAGAAAFVITEHRTATGGSSVPT